MAWLTRIGPHSGYADRHPRPAHRHRPRHGPDVLDRVQHRHLRRARRRTPGVASASVNTGQQLGGSIGTALLNTIAASATASYLVGHAHGKPTAALTQLALVHGYTTAFWWTAAIFLGGAILCGSLMRSGPLQGRAAPAAAPAATPAATEPAARVSAAE